MNGECTYTQGCLNFDKFLRTSSKARNEAYVAANKFEYWNKNLTRMLEIMTCYGADIIIGHSRKDTLKLVKHSRILNSGHLLPTKWNANVCQQFFK